MTAVAIDFGNSNTVVSTIDPVTNRPRVLNLPGICCELKTRGDKIYTIPSQVFIRSPRDFAIGAEVRLQRLGLQQPDRFFQYFKRDIAAKFRPPSRCIDGQMYDAEAIGEIFIKKIWQGILEQGITPTQVILTVPVGAFETYLDWYYDLSQSLDLPDVKFVDESTAAALGYGIEQPGTAILVVDFGAGTLDLSLVITNSVWDERRTLKGEVIAKSDAYVGGMDIDHWIAEFFLEQWQIDREEISDLAWLNLLERSELLKVKLSEAETATETWSDAELMITFPMHMSQDKLTDLLEEHQALEQIRQALDEVLSFAQGRGINKQAIERVLLVGGSSQIIAVKQLITSYFGRQKVVVDQPFTAVAIGALSLATKVKNVDDFLRHSYAIRLWEPYSRTYSYYPIFAKGTRYPTQRLEPLILQAANNGQTEIRLDIGELADTAEIEVVYDGMGRMTSRRLVRQSDFRSLVDNRGQKKTSPYDVCVAKLSPPGQVGVDRIRVDFAVNERRILLATIKDLLSGELLAENQPIAMLE
ncbi:MAG: Hsp70 family protein [Pseudanabaenaceae cyanobacterium SKYGB_i_bin29]|nr:Hsp70 family protein [Pseudanabaenaceae cyanobacterium SKYG29]MDW8422119.1 Hsp70 family protein [Pseudanabaenaceae cyanobacterium SKYGB_i_bin29]